MKLRNLFITSKGVNRMVKTIHKTNAFIKFEELLTGFSKGMMKMAGRQAAAKRVPLLHG